MNIILIFSEIWENLLRFGFPQKTLSKGHGHRQLCLFLPLSFHPFLSLSFSSSFFSFFLPPPFLSFLISMELEWNIRKNIIEEGKPIKTRIFGLTSSTMDPGLFHGDSILESPCRTRFRIVPLAQKATPFVKGCLKRLILLLFWSILGGLEKASSFDKSSEESWNCSCYFIGSFSLHGNCPHSYSWGWDREGVALDQKTFAALMLFHSSTDRSVLFF